MRLGLTCALATLPAAVAAQETVRVLDPDLHHLGDSRIETWPEVDPDPEATELVLRFEGQANRGEHVLYLRHRDVDNTWTATLNGTSIGALPKGKPMVPTFLVIPAGTLVDGANELAFRADTTTDDIVLGDVRLHLESLRRVLSLQPVEVRVTDGDGAPLPAKVTITRVDDAQLTETYYQEGDRIAVRKGIAYTADGNARFELSAGKYILHATRGTEWGLDRATIEVARAEPGSAPVGPIELTIRREVDTEGFVAADTHIHTYTHSGHGDATVAERLVTLACEGVELAIATDHNHHTDYRPLQAEMQLGEHFTAVTGNEVTTEVGHFNAFPFDANATLPNYKLQDWVMLVDDMRAQGARVVILNHPRWPQIPTGPFGVYHLNRHSGELAQQRVTFDAMELVNSTTLQNSPRYLLVDWFALLNHGERVTAVGTSDSHTVGDPVGQGRTYVRSSTDVPSEIDIDEACDAFLAGDTTVSLGIFCDLLIDDAYRMGETVDVEGGVVSLALRVAAPAWVRPRTAHVFLNGIEVVTQEVPAADGEPTDTQMDFVVPTPEHDAHLVCLVVGDGIREAFWRTMKPYTMAATNPVYLDVDGDGSYSHPRAVAERLVETHGVEPNALGPMIRDVDGSVAVEAASLARARYEADATDIEKLRAARGVLAELVRFGEHEVLTAYAESLPTPEKVFAPEDDGQAR